MRKVSKRLRVVERLSGGAHLLLPSHSSIAVRTYYPRDVERLNETIDWTAAIEALSQGRLPEGDSDNIAGFRDGFQFPFVFFVQPALSTATAEHLDRAGSFVHRAQMIMNEQNKNVSTAAGVVAPPRPLTSDRDVVQYCVSSAKPCLSTQCQSWLLTSIFSFYLQPNGRTFIVPDVASIIKTLVQLTVNLKPDKRALKDRYYNQAKTKYFHPDPTTGVPPSLKAAANHVKSEFQKWADLYELPPGEATVLMSQLGTLGAIASASHAVLENVPVDQDTKNLLHNFFGSEGKAQINMTADELVEDDDNTLGQWDENVFEFAPSPVLFAQVPSQIVCKEPHPQQYSPMHSSGATAGGHHYYATNGTNPEGNPPFEPFRQYQPQVQQCQSTRYSSEQCGLSTHPFPVMSNQMQPSMPPPRGMSYLQPTPSQATLYQQHWDPSQATLYQQNWAPPSSSVSAAYRPYSSRSDFPPPRQYY
jgi:hypothetical protein